MKHPAFIIDAFANRPFGGNPAAVCLLSEELDDDSYQKIAAEFNLSETAFPLPLEEGKDFRTASLFSLRWFSPTTEVPLCGHATLATSHALLYELGSASAPIAKASGNINARITFRSRRSGDLIVQKHASGAVEMDFPQYQITAVGIGDAPAAFAQTFPPTQIDIAHDVDAICKALLPKEAKIVGAVYAPEARKVVIVIDATCSELLHALDRGAALVQCHPSGEHIRGVAVTCAASPDASSPLKGSCDYLCRYFAPWVGIPEDPATGSAQCVLAPFWAKLKQRDVLHASQVYPTRGASFRAQLSAHGRLTLRGFSRTVLRGEVDL